MKTLANDLRAQIKAVEQDVLSLKAAVAITDLTNRCGVGRH